MFPVAWVIANYSDWRLDSGRVTIPSLTINKNTLALRGVLVCFYTVVTDSLCLPSQERGCRYCRSIIIMNQFDMDVQR